MIEEAREAREGREGEEESLKGEEQQAAGGVGGWWNMGQFHETCYRPALSTHWSQEDTGSQHSAVPGGGCE